MKTYRVFAYLIAVEVTVQAAALAYGSAGLGHWIYSDRHTATRATLEEGSDVDYTGKIGNLVHGENGAMIVPLLALALLVVAVIARKQLTGSVRWAAIVLGVVVLQVVLGFVTLAVPSLGALHAVNAFVLFLVALHAARLPAVAPASGHGAIESGAQTAAGAAT
jgi:heme A synthase